MRHRERDACGIGFIADATGRDRPETVGLALRALERMRHRGARGADDVSGDGAGLLLPIPRRFLAREARLTGIDPSMLGAAVVFCFEERDEGDARDLVGRAATADGLAVAGWRRVPVNEDALGAQARSTRPLILQALLVRPAERDAWWAERHAQRARRRIEQAARAHASRLYVSSCSFRTISYKALVTADRLGAFFPDLSSPDLRVPFAIFHQRFSTNTAPSWERVQPFRTLCHNGEINTIEGNLHRMRAREGTLGFTSDRDERLFSPPVDDEGSDSAILDEVVELLVKEGGPGGTGRDISRVISMLVPAAWELDDEMDEELRGAYRWHASVMEPWDGPAALVFTDGTVVGAALDRNGLRPMRIAACGDGLVVCASEAGAVDVSGRGLVQRRRLGPGEMVTVDPAAGGVMWDPREALARVTPYAAWADTHRVRWAGGDPHVPLVGAPKALQVAHGYTREDLALMLRPAQAQASEPVFSMGDDTPLPPLSTHGRRLTHHLRQRFAQVTNPAIDHVRERSVMSLQVLLGPRGPLLGDDPEAAGLLECDSFLLWDVPFGHRVDATWAIAAGVVGLEAALDRIGADAVTAVSSGSGIVVVSDTAASAGRAPVPSMLAVGVVNLALMRAGLRTRTSLVAEADDVLTSHDAACLFAVGAEAIVPRLAMATVAELARARAADADELAAIERYRTALEGGVLKAMARLGIACVDSYRGAEALDVLGLSSEVVDLMFVSKGSPVGGATLADLARDILARHADAFGEGVPVLADPGTVKFRRGGEHHAANPRVVRALHRVADPGLERLRTTAAARGDDPDADDRDANNRNVRAAHALNRAVREPSRPELYRRFSELVGGRPPTALRDIFEFHPAGPPLQLEAVEPIARILRRFSTGAISHGAISAEAHETLAIAMRMIGARANSGEGGEDPARFRSERNCGIKQVASGRFGVTPEYCVFADELQIKIAQGSKPGEGGQLPGHKVTEEIARLRHTQAGIPLISPAPHHDIYSIEDLAQLIFDLRQVNPAADVSVKLVASEGVGTVAVGVAKAGADVIHIAGAEGGTGASPLVSIKHVGMPWELGLSETHRALAESGLRDRVRLRVDGGMQTGRDVLAAALLGADECSFGTAALLAQGCLMVRSCHLDTCPAGIATQRPELRARFAGTPEMLAAYLSAVAEEVRTMLAALGLPSLEAAIGRTDLLRSVDGGSLALGGLLGAGHVRGGYAERVQPRERSELGDRIVADVWDDLTAGRPATRRYHIGNVDRSVGARLGGAIAGRFGAEGSPVTVHVELDGSAGQSFGAFLAHGASFRLIGEANDYVAKGMAGGRIVISPPLHDAGDPVLAGNAVLYGATGGELFIAGSAGERFAVRNSGASAVVEGVGDHACEYMTGGVVVVLGPVGRNVAAGMTGGTLFVLGMTPSEARNIDARVNRASATVRTATLEEVATCWTLLTRHRALTGSERAHDRLSTWDTASAHLRVVTPRVDDQPSNWASSVLPLSASVDELPPVITSETLSK